MLGVCIGAYIVKNPEFLNLSDGGTPNYNLAVPKFVTTALPHGVIGLLIVALFPAAMSSLDSTINSLSAASIETFTSASSVKVRYHSISN